MARSHKPIVWGLFAAGGTVSALLCPILIIVLGLAVPFGLLDSDLLSYDRLYAFVSHPIIRLGLFGCIMLCLWHAAHRTRTTAHDLGIHNDILTAIICYILAAIGTLAAAAVLIIL